MLPQLPHPVNHHHCRRTASKTICPFSPSEAPSETPSDAPDYAPFFQVSAIYRHYGDGVQLYPSPYTSADYRGHHDCCTRAIGGSTAYWSRTRTESSPRGRGPHSQDPTQPYQGIHAHEVADMDLQWPPRSTSRQWHVTRGPYCLCSLEVAYIPPASQPQRAVYRSSCTLRTLATHSLYDYTRSVRRAPRPLS